MSKPKAKNIGDVRKLSDRELVEAFFDDPSSRAIYQRVILERMKRDGYHSYFDWIWDTKESQKDKAPGTPVDEEIPVDENIIPMTRRGNKLGRELKAILQSSYDFSDVYEPRRCREFCSEHGNVYNLTEDELTPKQKRMLGLLRSRADRWLRGHKG